MSEFADAVLSRIRTRADLHRWRASDAHGAQMHEAVALLEEAAETEDPAIVLDVTQRAIASALKVVMRADDSSGIIGDACRDLLTLHPKAAAHAQPPPRKLVNWMMRFQFESECDFFELDPVAYAPALGDAGLASYRRRLDDVAATLGPRPSSEDFWSSRHAHEWFTLDHNAARLAVLDRDIDAIIRTHARDRQRAAWFQDTAAALEEIGEYGLAIDWAAQGARFDNGHQAQQAARYWCKLLTEHHPDALLAARTEIFERWPTSGTAGDLRDAAGPAWTDLRDTVMARLAARPNQAVGFALRTLDDPRLAWQLAHELGLDEDRTWADLATAYEQVDPVAVVPIHARLVDRDLEHADAQHYRSAARRLRRMRTITADTPASGDVDALIAELREIHRRRPRLQREFDRADLP